MAGGEKKIESISSYQVLLLFRNLTKRRLEKLDLQSFETNSELLFIMKLCSYTLIYYACNDTNQE